MHKAKDWRHNDEYQDDFEKNWCSFIDPSPDFMTLGGRPLRLVGTVSDFLLAGNLGVSFTVEDSPWLELLSEKLLRVTLSCLCSSIARWKSRCSGISQAEIFSLHFSHWTMSKFSFTATSGHPFVTEVTDSMESSFPGNMSEVPLSSSVPSPWSSDPEGTSQREVFPETHPESFPSWTVVSSSCCLSCSCFFLSR